MNIKEHQLVKRVDDYQMKHTKGFHKQELKKNENIVNIYYEPNKEKVMGQHSDKYHVIYVLP